MGRGISMATRNDLVRALGQPYRGTSRAEKERILDEFVAVTGYHRKHAVRLLRGDGIRVQRKAVNPHRRIYDEAVREALTVIWEAADRICGKRLKAVLQAMVESMEHHGHLCLDSAVRNKLLAVSGATIDRLLAPIRAGARGRTKRRRTTSTFVKRQVQVRTFGDWGDVRPGYCEGDFVVHNGGSTSGSCVHSLMLTDVSSGWVECLQLVVREQSLVVEGLEVIRLQLPVPLLGLDTDNDSAFMNETVLKYCRAQGIELTRSRPYRKNDQAWVEQKNGAVIRRFVGYERFVGLVATQTLARLYQVIRLYVNFFQPSFKLCTKTREGAKVRKSYLPPATPCDRLLSSEHVNDELKRQLREQRAELDPLRLLHAAREIQAALAALTASKSGAAPTTTPESKSLSQFLNQLPQLWREGEVRATHRKQGSSPRTWRTRADPFESVWPEMLGWLQLEPDATAKDLFERLREKYPDDYSSGQLRTLQRRVQGWRRAMARELIYASGGGV